MAASDTISDSSTAPDYSSVVDDSIWQSLTNNAAMQLQDQLVATPPAPVPMVTPLMLRSISPAQALARSIVGRGGMTGMMNAPVAGAGLRGRTPLPQGWETQILQGLGAPVNAQTIGDLDLWQRFEGGSTLNSASYNPLDTTLREPGSSAMNSVGVQAFPNWQEGLAATISTLSQPNMRGILNALRSGGGGFNAAVNASPWGSHLPG